MAAQIAARDGPTWSRSKGAKVMLWLSVLCDGEIGHAVECVGRVVIAEHALPVETTVMLQRELFLRLNPTTSRVELREVQHIPQYIGIA